jgi:phosphohistidine phosphatase SixA
MATIHLVIVRHAEAEDGSVFGDDSQRRLTQKGEREANALGRYRKLMSIPAPDLVFTSGYDRAEQTLERVLEGLSLRIVRDLQFSPEGSARKALELIQHEAVRIESPAGRLPTLWVVGHNPSIERLLSSLSGELGGLLRPFRKASLAWLKVRDIETEHPVAELIAYLPRPHDERERNSQPEP